MLINNKKLKFLVCLIILTVFGSISLTSLINATNADNLTGHYYYNIELYYNKGNIEIKSVEIEFSNEEKFNFNKDDSYYLEIIDSKNKILNKIFFSIPNYAVYDFVDEQGNFVETNESGLKKLENVSFNVFASYYENGHEIIVYNNDGKKEIDRKFVSQFSKTDFDKEDFTETEIENGIEKSIDNPIDEIVIEEKSNNAVPDYKNYIIILSLILISLIIVLIWFLGRKK